MVGCRPLLLAGALAVATPAPAQQTWVRSGGWEMLRDESRCGARVVAAGTSLTLWSRPAGSTTLTLRGTPAPAHGSRNRIRLALSLPRFESSRREFRFGGRAAPSPDGGTELAFGAEPGLADRVLHATSIAVSAGRQTRPLASFAVVPGGRPAAVLARCMREIALVDRGSGAPPATAPRPLAPIHTLFTSDDYPASALRAELSGRVTARLTVSAQGRVSDCVAVAGSGHAVLDEATCLILSGRARFEPARDAGGLPTEAPIDVAMQWVIPG